jgi:hypothetical protein
MAWFLLLFLFFGSGVKVSQSCRIGLGYHHNRNNQPSQHEGGVKEEEERRWRSGAPKILVVMSFRVFWV